MCGTVLNSKLNKKQWELIELYYENIRYATRAAQQYGQNVSELVCKIARNKLCSKKLQVEEQKPIL